MDNKLNFKSDLRWSVCDIWNTMVKTTKATGAKERDYISFSDLGKDYWNRYMKMTGVEHTNPFEDRVLRIFSAGDEFHNLMKNVFRACGILINTQDEPDKKGKEQYSIIEPADNKTLKVLGKYDALVGGVPERVQAERYCKDWGFSDFITQRTLMIVDKLKETYPNEGLPYLLYEFKSINCVAKGELIFTTKGLKKIENIKQGNEIYSIKNNLSLTKNKVKNIYKSGKKEIFRITTKTGKTILTTNEHKLLTTNIQWLADRNILPRNIIWKKVSDIKVGNKIAVVNKYPENYLKQKINTEIALVLGYLIGDGYVGKHHSDIVVNTIDEANNIKNIIDKYFNLDCNIKKYKSLKNVIRINITGGIKNRKGRYNQSNKFLNFLRKNNINQTKTNKEIPKIILNSSNDIISAFLNGLFQADGSCAKHGNSILINYGSISKKLAKQVSHCLLRLGIQNSLYTTNHKKSGFRSKNSIFYQINIRSFSIKDFSKIIGFVGQKDKKLKCLIKNWQQNSRNRKENIFFDIIKKIELVGIKETYDIETELINKDNFTHSFCCEDIIVHNSMAFWHKKDYLTEAYPHHILQLYAALVANDIPEGRLLYISKDDLVTQEFAIKKNDRDLHDKMAIDIKQMSYYILANEEPPKPAPIVFNPRGKIKFQRNKVKLEIKGCFEPNWQISRSNYLTLLTGKKTAEEWENSLKTAIKEKNDELKKKFIESNNL